MALPTIFGASSETRRYQDPLRSAPTAVHLRQAHTYDAAGRGTAARPAIPNAQSRTPGVTDTTTPVQLHRRIITGLDASAMVQVFAAGTIMNKALAAVAAAQGSVMILHWVAYRISTEHES